MKSFFGFLLGLILMLIPLMLFHIQSFGYSGYGVLAVLVVNTVIYVLWKNKKFAIASYIGCAFGLLVNWFTFYSF